ncbi:MULTISPECIES: PEPxxWA-CTERM sorting domain-containing protein [unclassified Sphingobium]|uniref:PEPxxWA-CTERM sorting domain-containing protein n=1 Tax=unclassified Sphingobium TaxID=2611147 RepID=UPI0022249375|nr:MULTISPECIES: PEPxxWA-CTERM sorting domain-containing protein [unclassified Sphingobium]MCW2395902.1 opacity protein-like surface antigen [Sphingobium sp. B8D3B]MCW2419418.1 opacity protein-like surface antigen [Sphingobium sp. B8D3C]
MVAAFMLRLLLAAVLAVIAMPAQAATVVHYQASGPASGYMDTGKGTAEFTGMIYVDAIFPAQDMMGYWCTPPVSCFYAGSSVIGRNENEHTYGNFRLEFDHILTGMPLTEDGFLGGTALGNVYGLPPGSGGGSGTGTLTSLTVTTYEGSAGGGSVFVSVVPNAVPEPATWAMMILGFGLLGGALRRQAQLSMRSLISSRPIARICLEA